MVSLLRGACKASHRSLPYRWTTSASRHLALLHSGPSSQSSVNPEEIAHFSKLSQAWWDERGEFGLLHKMNPVRMQFIRNKVVREERTDNSPSPHLV